MYPALNVNFAIYAEKGWKIFQLYDVKVYIFLDVYICIYSQHMYRFVLFCVQSSTDLHQVKAL